MINMIPDDYDYFNIQKKIDLLLYISGIKKKLASSLELGEAVF